MPRWLIAIILSLCALLWWAARHHATSLTATSSADGAAQACRVLQVPPVLDNDAVQSEQAAPPFHAGDANFTPLAAFSISARVLSREDYSFGREANYSPTDLALGWGPMSAPGLADRLGVRQGGRWYRYSWGGEGPPMPPAEIARHSANMHMVPADAAVASALSDVKAGQAVRLDGWLLQINGDDGWRWRSSMSRDDVGAGACELILVCAVQSR